MIGQAAGSAGERARSRRRVLLVCCGAVVVAAVLLAGIALGMALHDNPRPTGPLTVERTLDPLP